MRSHTRGPLAGVRVIDLAGPSAAFATHELAELGADVIRVEAPGGCEVRRRPPYLHGTPGVERGLHHLHFNAGKRSVVLDLEAEPDRGTFRAIAATADLLVETAPPGWLEERGLGHDALRAANPGLIQVSVTPYDRAGDRAGAPATDLTVVASSGLMYLNGLPEDPPVQPGAEQGHHMGGLAAAATALVALVGRDRDPAHGGHRVDVSLQAAASMATLQTANANIRTWHGQVPGRRGVIGARGERALYPCRDGRWLSFVVPIGAPALWDAFTAWVRDEGLGEPFTGPDWADPAYRAAHAATTTDVIGRLCAAHDRAYLFHEGQRRRMLTMPVSTVADLVASEHLAERGFLTTVPHPELGVDLLDTGPPYRFGATPAGIGRRAPLLGEDTAEVVRAAAAARPAPAPARGTAPRGLLDGLRVADFCWLIAGPLMTRLLADHGADVIKIESRARLDTIRAVGVQPGEPPDIDTNGVFNDCNTGKRSVRLNLAHPRGVELAKEIVRHSDVVTNNFTGDRMDRWGLGYDDLVKVRPDLVMLTMPAMGVTGPYRRYGSYGNGLVAYSGLNHAMGFPGRPPTGMGPLYSDFSAPYAAAAALLAALHHRHRTGEGQFIEVTQAEATMNLLGTDVLEYTANGDLRAPAGNRSREYAPHGAFPCRGDDRWCVLAVRTDDDWRHLVDLVGAGLAPYHAAALAERRAHEDAIEAAIAAWTRTLDAWEAVRRLRAAGLAAAVVADLADLVTRDPDMPARHLVPLDRDGITYTTHTQPATVDGHAPPPRPAPRFGEHTADVLTGLLGLTDGDIAGLVAERVLY